MYHVTYWKPLKVVTVLISQMKKIKAPRGYNLQEVPQTKRVAELRRLNLHLSGSKIFLLHQISSIHTALLLDFFLMRNVGVQG